MEASPEATVTLSIVGAALGLVYPPRRRALSLVALLLSMALVAGGCGTSTRANPRPRSIDTTAPSAPAVKVRYMGGRILWRRDGITAGCGYPSVALRVTGATRITWHHPPGAQFDAFDESGRRLVGRAGTGSRLLPPGDNVVLLAGGHGCWRIGLLPGG